VISNTRPISVLVVDDSRVYRKLIIDVVGKLPNARVIGEAADGLEALEALQGGPVDLVLLDVEMPNMDGLATLQEIRRRHAQTGVVMISGTNKRAADITIQALELGALDFIPKPRTTSYDESHSSLTLALAQVVECVRQGTSRRGSIARTLSLVPAGPTRPSAAPPAPQRREAPRPATAKAVPKKVALVLLGISTGGPRALSELIPALDPALAAPLLVVQHMPEGFTKSLADQLAKKSRLPVLEAADGSPASPGRVLIAPGGRHMVLRGADGQLTIGVNDAPPVKSCRPSVDVLFSSAAGLVKGSILTVIMTGMGNDGADGVRALARHRSYNLAQDEATCTVYGMPRAIVDDGLADEILPLGRIAGRINELAGNGASLP
jgi:two-component system, chemotaxis family, protein-glutamate methylesterase/glutaminase